MKNLVVLTGAGISAESGLQTFRDSGGLWESYQIEDVATLDAWHRNPELVLQFYNLRRRQLNEVQPNQAHYLLKLLESNFNVQIITQNVDDLHERALSSHVLHLHGELNKMCSSRNKQFSVICNGDIHLDEKAEDGSQLRPDIVWFGEDVPMLGPAMDIVKAADVLLIIGTSLQVYPAASLAGYAHRAKEIYYIDPNPAESYETRALRDRLITIPMNAVAGMAHLYELLTGQKP